MRTPQPVPSHLADRAFHRTEALTAGLTSRALNHPRFVRLYPQVFALRSVRLSRAGAIHAATLALPDDAALSHMTRLELCGVRSGTPTLHFTVARELHLNLDGVMLHRTVKMPPCDNFGVSISAAFVQSASALKPIQAIALADRLLARELTSVLAITEMASLDPWRPGAELIEHLLPWVNPLAASMPESEVRCIIAASGLEIPEVNAPIIVAGEQVAIGDLVYWLWKLIIEYEGSQHAFDADQFSWDIERYRRLREAGWEYLRITARHLAAPKALVRMIHQALVRQGYQGPEPEFGPIWDWLFRTPRLRVPGQS